MVHHVKGKFKDEYYHNQSGKVWDEIDDQFDLSTNIYFTALDISTKVLHGGACGYGGYRASGGTVLIPASGACFDGDYGLGVAVHELGHAFGLQHDYRNNLKPWIDTYTIDPMITSICAAGWLDVHPYFNPTNPNYFNKPTTIEMWSPGAARPNGIRFRFKITDLDGLHQAQLFSTLEYGKTFEYSILDCKPLDGSSNIVEFSTTQLKPETNAVTLRIIDAYGNFTEQEFLIDASSLLQQADH